MTDAQDFEDDAKNFEGDEAVYVYVHGAHFSTDMQLTGAQVATMFRALKQEG